MPRPAFSLRGDKKPASHVSICAAGGAHHMTIDAPDGRQELPGICKKCGRTRDYSPFHEGDFDTLRAFTGRQSA